MNFDTLLQILKEYLEMQFFESTITRCIKLTENVSTQCDDDLKVSMIEKCRNFQLLTKEYHPIPSEKLPKFQLFISLHKKISRVLLQRNDDEIEELYHYITSGKFEEEVQLIHDKYLMKNEDVIMLAKISEIITEAKAKGHTIEVRHAKVMVCGSSAVGKTNFINLLLGDKFVTMHNATVVTTAKDTMVKEIVVSENENLVEYKEQDLECQINMLQSHLYHKQYKNATSDTSDHEDLHESMHSSKLDINKDAVINEFEVVKKDTVVNKDVVAKEDLVVFQHEFEEAGINSATLIANSFTQESDFSTSDYKSDIEKKLAAVQKDIKKLPKTWDVLTFLDTGGQPEYISMLPAVNSSVMITFVVLNLKYYNLLQNVAVFTGVDVEENPPDLLAYDYSTLIKMLVSMRKPQMEIVPHEVVAKKAEKTSYLSFIGCKSDIVTEELKKNLDEVVDNIDKELKKHLSACLPDVLTFVDGKYLTAVSNCNAGEKDEDNNAKRIRLKLYEKMQESAAVYNIPITWLLLELEIKSWCVNKKRNYMTLQEIKNLCANRNLLKDNVNDIMKFLKFYHILGVFLCYVEIGNEIIITNLQWFFENLSKLVTFSTRSNHRHDYKKLLKQGLVNNKVFQKMQFDVSEDLPLDYFIKVFEFLNIIAMYSSSNREVQYFVPCILSTCNLTNVTDLLKNKGNDHGKEPLLFQMSGTDDCTDQHSIDLYYGFPSGIFCSLVAYLVRKKTTDFGHVTLLLSPDFLHNNFLIFQYFYDDGVDDEKYNVILLNRYTYLEVQIRCKKLKDAVYHDIRALILDSLTTVIGNLKFSANSICVAFECRECKGEFHLTRNTLKGIKSKKPFHCLPNAAEDKKYLNSIWFGDITQVKMARNKISEDVNMRPELSKMIFQENYANLCSTVMEIDSLLKYFVTENVINIFDEEDIRMSVNTSAKVKKLLLHISGPLQAGDTHGFYVMLEIMKSYGTKSTQQLAENMMLKLNHAQFTDKSNPMDVQNQDTVTTKEYEILMANYSKFCDILKTELELLPKFVQDNIITADRSQDIPSIPTAQKGVAILTSITGPVQSGQTEGFYAMIRIMKEHGKTDTQVFASMIERELSIQDDTPDTVTTKEYEILMANYSKFCDILKTELELLPKFVQDNIITADRSQDIPSIPAAQKGVAILTSITGPVQSGQTERFYAMIRIMKEHGKTYTQVFASKIERELGIQDDTPAHAEKWWLIKHMDWIVIGAVIVLIIALLMHLEWWYHMP
ncbi:uncharacterized protein [Dysidea avara]|uniref:uncharacterized protein isoform X2 n=1 Tax=Dysidea avara TaxID=196820 RepID=UPI00332C08F1